MDITYRRLYSKDKSIVLELIQSRIDADSRICLTENRVNDNWVHHYMTNDYTYDVSHRIFGAFINNSLNTIFVLRLVDNYYIVSMMMSTKEHDRPSAKIVNGYNEISAGLLDFSMREMESEGYNIFYSMIPDHPRWKRAEKNPNKTKLRYKIEEVLKIPAGTMPASNIDYGFSVSDIISRPFNIDMVVRRMTKL